MNTENSTPDLNKFLIEFENLIKVCNIDNHPLLVHTLNFYMAYHYPTNKPVNNN